MDPFKCYKVTNRTAFQPRPAVLVDQFGNQTVQVVRPIGFCNPVVKDREGPIRNMNNHLACYAIDVVKDHPSRQTRFIRSTNQWGAFLLEVERPTMLCLPTEKRGFGQPDMDHFKCYRVRNLSGFDRRTVHLEDQFEKARFVAWKLTLFCNPVEKDGGRVNDATTHLTCFAIHRAQGEPKFVPRQVIVNNQYGTQDLRVEQPRSLCLPSLKDPTHGPKRECKPAQGKTVTAVTLPTAASGTVRDLPELGILEVAPVGEMVQSSYFRTTDVNREFRRGFVEFAIPAFAGGVVSAQLVLTENRATITAPVPPDVHELSHYAADLVITSSDFGLPTTLLASFETDANLPTQAFSFDVTCLVLESQATNLGFRLKLAVDPANDGFGSLGSSFCEPACTVGFPKIVVMVPS